MTESIDIVAILVASLGILGVFAAMGRHAANRTFDPSRTEVKMEDLAKRVENLKAAAPDDPEAGH